MQMSFERSCRINNNHAAACVAAAAVAMLVASPHTLAATRYVDASLASGANDGTSWANAYQGAGGLAIALAAAIASDQIWVAQGAYKPTLTATRTISFNLKSGVEIYGGFAGGETTLDQRDFNAHVTILTGDLLGNDGPPGSFTNNADNSHHVVNGAGANSTAILDGFSITAGFANLASNNFDKGGGIIFLTNSNGTIRNCIIEYNRCTFGGGAVYINSSSPGFVDVIMRNNIGGSFGGAIDMATNCSPLFNRCQFIGNTAARAGGVEIFGNSHPTIYNCLFSGNSVTGANGGGALWIGNSSSANLRNCTIANNTSTSTGAGIQNSSSTVTAHNCIIWNNTGPGGATLGQQINGGTNTVSYSIVHNGFAGTANLANDPQFVSASDLRLQPNSPAIDSGNNSLVPISVALDLDHNPRKVDDPGTVDTGVGTPPLVDRGAYEFQPVIGPACPADIVPAGGDGAVNVADLLAVIGAWGPCAGCPADIDGNGTVNVADLLAVINAWGPCP
jgi:hypothetical protein